MQQTLKDKRILVFTPAFFNFEGRIQQKLRELGADFDYFDERSVTSAFGRGLLRYFPKVFTGRTKRYYRRIIEKCADRDYDFVLIVRCDMPSLATLHELREAFPRAVFCLHLWDSLRNIKHIETKLAFFERITSFDPEDCRTHPSFIFRPNFYFDEYLEPQEPCEKEYDISFCGTVHSDRYSIIKQVKTICEQRGLRFHGFFYLQRWFVFYVFKLTNPLFKTAKKSDFSYEKMSSADIREIERRSTAVLDIQHPSQTGLTLRPFETMCIGKKIITTCGNIVDYDFYNPSNILVIDREAVDIPEEFLNTRYVPVNREILERYSLERWLLDIFYK